MNITRVIFTSVLTLLISSGVFAAKLELGSQSGELFSYNNEKEYASINLKDLNLPSIEDTDSKLAKFFKKLFIDRKKYGVAYIEVTPEFGDKQKTILFTYERASKDRYKYKYIGAKGNITYPISREFIYTDPVSIDIIIKEWEDENASSAVKTILDAAGSSNLAIGNESVLSNITLMLDLVESLFPADSTVEALSLKLNKNDVKNSDIQVLGDGSEFFKLSLSANESFFKDYDTNKGLQRARIENSDAWKQVISNADKNLSSDGKAPLIAVVQSFSDFISNLPINRDDQALLTACAINDWADEAVKGNIVFEGESAQFTAHDYSQLPTSNLSLVRKSRCDFKGVNCNTSNCLSMSDFINKSSRSSSRKAASELYIDGELTITFSDSELTLTAEDYISLFRISRAAYFDTEPTGPNSWSYHFAENTLDMRVKGKRYKPYKIRIDLVKDNSSSESKYIVTGIEVESEHVIAAN
jgi:hypothetical protein